MKAQNYHKIEQGREAAFSLVEVTLSMAIAAVALVSIIGMLPQGMQTMRDAGDRAIQARIHQQILNELQMTPYGGDTGKSPLDDYDGLEIFYDSQGEELGDSNNNASVKGSFDHIFTARVSVPKDGGRFPDTVGGNTFNGFAFSEGSGVEESKYLRPILVEIAVVSGRPTFDWGDEDNQKLISVYQSYVVKMGKDYTRS